MEIEYNLTTIIIIILIFSLLGFNLFHYLGNTLNFIKNIVQNIGGETIDVTKSAVETSARGTKFATDIVSGTVTGGLGVLERTIGGKKSTIHENPPITDRRKLARQQRIMKPDNSDSSIQLPPKRGYCYIGKEKNLRTCVYVSPNDTCMSGEIYPTMSVCVNPNLRV